MNSRLDFLERNLCTPEIVRFHKRHISLSFDLMKAIPAFHIIRSSLQTIRDEYSNSVIESSSGTFALGLAYVCKFSDINLQIVTDSVCSSDFCNYLQTLGVDVHLIESNPNEPDIQSRRLSFLTERLKYEKIFWPRQYENALVYQSYPIMLSKYILSPEVLLSVTDVVVSTGSGGSGKGIRNWIRSVTGRDVRLHAVDSSNSCLFGRAPGPRKLRGLGSSINMPFISSTEYSSVYFCDDDKTLNLCSSLLQVHGLFKGVTSGVVYACADHLATMYPDRVILSVLPDSGYRYLSTNFIAKPVQYDDLIFTRLAMPTDTFPSHFGWYSAEL